MAVILQRQRHSRILFLEFFLNIILAHAVRAKLVSSGNDGFSIGDLASEEIALHLKTGNDNRTIAIFNKQGFLLVERNSPVNRVIYDRDQGLAVAFIYGRNTLKMVYRWIYIIRL